ncbi:hypothetical protein MTO96_019807 [Rhipicephalus appendiculatus]
MKKEGESAIWEEEETELYEVDNRCGREERKRGGRSVFRGRKQGTDGGDLEKEREEETFVPKERLPSVRLLADARSSDTTTAAATTSCVRRLLAL